MGTRSLTVINDEWDNEEICVLYRQYDGYPEGHGTDLLNFLKGINLVNGINNKNIKLRISNGMDCLAAQIVAHFKQQPGYFYLKAAGSRDMCEEFIYTIHTKDRILHIKVEDVYDEGNVLFDGNINQYEEWLNTPEITGDKDTDALLEDEKLAQEGEQNG